MNIESNQPSILKPDLPSSGPTCHHAHTQPLRLACLGDSLTEGVHGGGKPYPTFLSQHLQAQGFNQVEVRGFGHSGATLMYHTNLPYNRTREWRAILEYRPHIIVVLLGTNDSKRKYFMKAGGRLSFVREMKYMLSQLRVLSSSPDIILGIPPPAYRPIDTIDQATIVSEIQPAIMSVGAELGFPTFSLQEPVIVRSMMHDGVHLNPTGRRKMGAAIGDAVLECVGKR
eukprot:NODE_3697_length_1175_cov_40.188213_g3512_i0.p1 GENE.NODE_3697_length_1175_cov_40.188213_g3512_i0~~NODE_3697_length_1175_cov_40.188213_g3512_i0.p1  ORF type:complete len:228 (-),score=17.80 NODE_3697_length_1175_cov_40.188213_g3512_i0:133-816(-)